MNLENNVSKNVQKLLKFLELMNFFVKLFVMKINLLKE